MSAAMHRETFRFDQVYSIARNRTRLGMRYTNFGFESGGKRFYDISISGWPHIEEGMSVVAFFLKEKDWNTCLGWVDSYGNASFEPTSPAILLIPAIASIFMMILFLAGNYSWQANTLISTVFGGPALVLLRSAMKLRAFHKALNSEIEALRFNHIFGQRNKTSAS